MSFADSEMYKVLNALALAVEDLRNYGHERVDLEKIKDKSYDIRELKGALVEANDDLRTMGYDTYGEDLL